MLRHPQVPLLDPCLPAGLLLGTEEGREADWHDAAAGAVDVDAALGGRLVGWMAGWLGVLTLR